MSINRLTRSFRRGSGSACPGLARVPDLLEGGEGGATTAGAPTKNSRAARARRLLLAALVFGLATLPVLAGQTKAARFDAQIAPLLARSCVECHSATNKQGGLDLTTSASALKGGSRGPALAPGKPEASWLWKRVAAGEMP